MTMPSDTEITTDELTYDIWFALSEIHNTFNVVGEIPTRGNPSSNQKPELIPETNWIEATYDAGTQKVLVDASGEFTNGFDPKSTTLNANLLYFGLSGYYLTTANSLIDRGNSEASNKEFYGFNYGLIFRGQIKSATWTDANFGTVPEMKSALTYSNVCVAPPNLQRQDFFACLQYSKAVNDMSARQGCRWGYRVPTEGLNEPTNYSDPDNIILNATQFADAIKWKHW